MKMTPETPMKWQHYVKKWFGFHPVKTGLLPLWDTGGVSGTLSATTSGTGSVGFYTT